MGIQKFFAKLTTVILSVQLMAGDISRLEWVGSAIADTTCSSGLEYNSILGRCLSSEAASKVAQASATCNSQATDAAKRQCFADAAEGKLKEAEASGQVAGQGKISGDALSTLLTLAGLGASVLFLATGGGACPGATSAYLIAGGSVAVLAGEILASSQYKSKMKKAKEALSKASGGSEDSSSTTSSESSNIQAQAFDALIQQEDAVISAGSTKKKLYLLATAAYAAATVMAAIEGFRMGFAPHTVTCTAALDSKGDRDSIVAEYLDARFMSGFKGDFTSYLNPVMSTHVGTMAEYLAYIQETDMYRRGALASPQNTAFNSPEPVFQETKELKDVYSLALRMLKEFTLRSAHAQAVMGAGAAPTAAAPAAEAGAASAASGSASISAAATTGPAGVQAQGFKKLFSLPVTRTALAGILTLNNVFMLGKISKEQNKAKERKKFLEDLKAQVTAAGEAFGCTGTDRNNTAKPQCYCYDDTGAFNTARNNSAICQALNKSNSLASTDYSTSSGDAIPTSCTNRSGQLDTTCSCKSSNSCLTITSGPTGNSTGGISVSDTAGTLNAINGGSLNAGQIDSAAVTTAAARYNAAAAALASKNPAIKAAQDKAKKIAADATAEAQRSLASSGASLANSGFGGFGDSSSLLTAKTPQEALERVKLDIARNEAAVSRSGTGSKDDIDFSGVGSGGPAGGVVMDQQMAAAMDKALTNSNSDINTDSDTNIFDIVSSRYQRSGMRRLFGGEASVPADAPSAEQVNRK